jgi:4-alpha-glucanotransferase
VRLTFQLRFHTHPGQSLRIAGNHPLLGAGDTATAREMEYLNDRFWRISVDLPEPRESRSELTYRYILRQPDGTLLEDWGNGRVLSPASFSAEELLVIDSWNHPGFYQNAFYTEPFRKVLLSRWHTDSRAPRPDLVTHLFKVKAPLLKKNQTLCLLGSNPALRSWNTNEPILLNRLPREDWLTVELDLSRELFPFEYKYGVYDIAQKKFLEYEGGANRTFQDTVLPGKVTVVNDGFVVLACTEWRGAGVAVPVFSLRSQSSFGVGEFTDLELFADWCQQAGLKLIQILPVNDTSATHSAADSYPYAAISAFALHPLYLNLSRVASAANRHVVEALEEERKRLNSLEDLDYEAVMSCKMKAVKELYHLQAASTFKSRDYREFFKANEHWLVPYATFCYLRDKNGTADFNRWTEHQECSASVLASLATPNSGAWDELALNYFIQYQLHLQLRAATKHAHQKGVVLKGDIAIGVYRYGADAWQQPSLYNMKMQAGAPPDAFGIKGQNWSFPTYDWAKMKATGFAWWKQRFEQMASYFDAFRIDHILGFFRIWSIPIHAVEGIMGHFVPAIPVRPGEFSSHGIQFNRQRFTAPFITNAILRDLFGGAAPEVTKDFLQARGGDQYQLRPEFATQRQVERHFDNLPATPENRQLKEGLFDLISNVILFEDEQHPKDSFHFRFAIETTASFKNLDDLTQSQLRELYLDYFFRRQDGFWMQEAMQKLPGLKRVTNMLVCGEDLGMVPACVPEAMKQLGLLSLEVQRMPKRLNQEFSYPHEAPYLSVVTPSTHDMSTIRGWWTEDRTVTQRFYNHVLGLPGEAPLECDPSMSRTIIRQHLESPAMWSIFQVQDLLGMDQHLRRPNPAEERINVPADAKNYWRYRLHLFLEDLLRAKEFNHALKEDIARSGR